MQYQTHKTGFTETGEKKKSLTKTCMESENTPYSQSILSNRNAGAIDIPGFKIQCKQYNYMALAHSIHVEPWITYKTTMSSQHYSHLIFDNKGKNHHNMKPTHHQMLLAMQKKERPP